MARNWQAGLFILGMIAVQGCGFLGGAKHSGGGSDSPNDSGESVLGLDVSNLQMLNNDLTSATGKTILWSIKASVDGSAGPTVDKKPIADVATALENVHLRPSNKTLRLEITVYDDSNTALATNLMNVAEATDAGKATWASECKDISPDLAIDSKAFKSGEKKVGVEARVCDLAGLFYTPTVSVPVQTFKSEKKTVVYRCPLSYDSMGDNIFRFGKTDCTYGYDGPNPPVVEIPAGLKTIPKVYGVSVTKTLTGPQLNVSFDDNSSVGSYADCHTLEFDLQGQRLQFDKSSINGRNLWWTGRGDAKSISFQTLADHWRATNMSEPWYIICDWYPVAGAKTCKIGDDCQTN